MIIIIYFIVFYNHLWISSLFEYTSYTRALGGHSVVQFWGQKRVDVLFLKGGGPQDGGLSDIIGVRWLY